MVLRTAVQAQLQWQSVRAAPSALAFNPNDDATRVLDRNAVRRIVDHFVAAAERAALLGIVLRLVPTYVPLPLIATRNRS